MSSSLRADASRLHALTLRVDGQLVVDLLDNTVPGGGNGRFGRAGGLRGAVNRKRIRRVRGRRLKNAR